MAPQAVAYTHFWDVQSNFLTLAKWRTPFPLHYRLGMTGTADIAGNREWGIIQESFDVWQACPELAVSFVYDGLTAATDTIYDGVNTVIFVDDLGAGYLAATTVTAVVELVDGSPTLRIVDADLRVNDTPAIQFVDGPSQNAAIISLKGVVVHEIGHVLGLHHSMGRESTMWWLTRKGQETLDTDDIAGMAELYPAADHGIETASVEGYVHLRRQDNSVVPYFGGNVLAVNCHTGKAFAADVSRTSAYPPKHGYYCIQGLAPGPYAIYCEKTRGQFLYGGPVVQPGGTVNGYYGSMALSAYYPRCYGDGSSNILAGRVVSVTGGETLSAADIEIVENATDVLEGASGNDTPQTAVEIGEGSAIAALVHNSFDVDYYTFHVDRPATVYLTVECTQSRHTDDVMEWAEEPDLAMTLFADDGQTPLSQSDNYWFTDPFIFFHASRPGRYYLKVEDKSGHGVPDVDYMLCLSTGNWAPSAVPVREWDAYE